MTSLVSPGSSVSLTWCAPCGDQPCAIELVSSPRSTPSGSWNPRDGPGDASRWVARSPVRAEERLALAVEPRERRGAGEVREVVAALAVLGLVVDDPVGHLDLAGRVVALVVRRVVLCVPEGELDGGEERKLGRRLPVVGDGGPPDLVILAARHEVHRLRRDPCPGRLDGRVRQPVPALVGVKRRPGGLPRWRPVITGAVIPQVEVAASGVTGHVVVPVPGEPAQPGVQVPGVASGRVRDGTEVLVRAQVVDPRHRSVRPGDHVLAAIVVEIAVAHSRYFTGLVLVRPWAIEGEIARFSRPAPRPCRLPARPAQASAAVRPLWSG